MCLSNAHRQKAASVHQFEIMPMPPSDRAPHTPWPLWPVQLRVESSHEEGGVRAWSMATTSFTGDEYGRVKVLHGIEVGPAPKFEPLPGTEFTMEADLVLLAMGFTGPNMANPSGPASEPESAATEFQKILKYRGLVLADPVGALAHLQLGRAFRLSGDSVTSKAAYEELFRLWKDADPDVPLLKQARIEYAKLR